MSHSLPNAPSLEQLRKQAKDLVKAHRSRNQSACDTLRHLARLERASDEEILATEITLTDAQHAIARLYGFAQWADLKHHVENAVSKAVPQKVLRENGRVWIDGVPQLGWGRSGDCTFAGALSAALAATDRPVAYSDLMGYSGLAFRFRWYRRFDEPVWCPSSPVGEFTEEIMTVTEAIGWQIRQHSRMGDEQKDMSASAPAIRQSIDAGRPVVGYPDSDLNVGVCYGYEQAGDETTFLWNAYGRNEIHIPAAKVGPWLMFLDEAVEPMEPKAALTQSLTTPNWRRKKLDAWNRQPGQNVAYLYGTHALRQWREDIGQAEEFSLDQRKQLFFVGWWCFGCLVDARRCAATFLTDYLSHVPDEARVNLARAADSYRQLVRMATQECFEKHTGFLGPWSGKRIEDWTPEVRQREQEILSQVDALDLAAATEIDKAVNTLK